ncbi:MAG: hypothetical protein KBG15_00100 [Kofleriaceae bacterium]|nr:hypothetical protein [Kofleriaceae bacterium]
MRRWTALCASVLVACSVKSTPGVGNVAGSGASSVPSRAGDEVAIADAATRLPLLHRQQQLITAVTADWQSAEATLQLWHRDAAGHWQPDDAAWSGVIGKNGAAWGIGLHGNGPPVMPPGVGGTGPGVERTSARSERGPIKAEGDQRSPAGAFELGGAFGYAEGERSKLPYAAVGPTWRCVDDSASVHYNRVFDSKGVAVDWQSAELMRRKDALYTLVIETKHNAGAQAGAGSCIFLHVWRDAQSPTVGCTAMPQARLRWLLGNVDPVQRPAFVLLPRSVYGELAASWDLPTARFD